MPAAHPLTLTITGDPATFKAAGDLTNETHDTLLTMFELEMATTYGTDFLKTGIRTMYKVRDLAIASGYSILEADRLEETAGLLYAALMRDAAADLAVARRRKP